MQERTEIIDKLFRYVRGELSETERKQVEKRLASDTELTELLALITDLHQQRQTTSWDELYKPAHKLLQRLLQDTRKNTSEDEPVHGITIFDSNLLPQPEEIRPAIMNSRRLKYSVGDWQLTVTIYPSSPDSCELIGQLEGYQESAPLIVKLISKRMKSVIRANEFHIFRFDRAPLVPFTLQFESGGQVLAIVDIGL